MSTDSIKKKHAQNLKELRRLMDMADNDRDSNGVYILNDYPYRVILNDGAFGSKKYDGCLEWLENNVDERAYRRVWVNRFYFKNEEDATAFKLKWS